MSAAAVLEDIPAPLVTGVVVGTAALVLVGAFGWYVKNKTGAATISGGLAQWLGKQAGDVAPNVVLGVGDGLGIPRTNSDQCTKDLTAGDMWAASFSCPATRFVREGLLSRFGLASSTPPIQNGGNSAPVGSGASGSW